MFFLRKTGVFLTRNMLGGVGCLKYSSGTIQERKINVKGININYIKVGNGPKNVLCIPGALGYIWSDFKPQIESLDRKLFTVYVLDLPGYGKSIPPKRNFNPNFYVDDAHHIANFMQTLGVAKFSPLGWSDGGISGMILCALYPNFIDKLVVWGSNAYVLEEEIKAYNKLRDLSKWSDKMKAPLVALYGERGLEFLWHGWCDALTEIYKNSGDICKTYLAKIECPTFILHGNKDPMVAPEHPDYLLANIKNSRIFRFPDGKHNVHLRYAKEFNEIVTEFLKE